MVEVVSIISSGHDSNSYLILDEQTVLIDTGTGFDDVIKKKVMSRTEKVDIIINTHAHFDHVGGNQMFESPIAIHSRDATELEKGNLYGTSALFGKEAKSNVERFLNDGDTIKTGEFELKIIHTPGHTPGSICIHTDQGHLFSGDTLFTHGSFGRTDLSGGSSTQLLKSLERLKSLDFEFLMPGHMNPVKNGKEHLKAAISLFGDLL